MKLLLSLLFSISIFASESEMHADRDHHYFDAYLAYKVLTKTVLTVPTDVYNMAASPFQNPSHSLAALGLVTALVVVDKPTTTFYQEHVESNLDLYTLKTINPDSNIAWLMGNGADSWLTYGLAFHYLSGFAFGDEKSQVASLLSVKSIVYSIGISQLLLKSITGRQRPKSDLKECTDTDPDRTCNPYDFGNWHTPSLSPDSYGTSMPSYHVTMFVSVATVYAEMYDNYWLPYIVAGVLYASDIKGHHHWVSDLVAGGIVGTFIGHQVVRSYKEESGKPKEGITIIPTLNGVTFSYNF